MKNVIEYLEMTTNSELIGQRIMELRKKKKLQQWFMADELNLTQSGYSKLEKGQRKIPSDVLARICEILECDANYLLGITDEPLSKVSEPGMHYKRSAPKLKLSIEFTDDDTEPDGPLVKRLEEFIKKINAQK